MPFSGKDETRTCSQCRQPFVFTIGEQRFYEEKDFKEPPQRCPACRRARKAARMEQAAQEAPVDNYNDYDRGGRRRR